MLKLVKYEWKKQRTSRLVILGLLVAGIIAFWGGILFKSDTVTALSLAFLYIFAVLVLFYTGVESVLVFNRDLRTKQSYMLFMVPKSIWEILGAKFISAILQMLFVFALFFAAGSLNLMAAVWRSGKIEALVHVFENLMRTITEANFDWMILVEAAFILFLSWVLIILIGFLAVILARTVLVKSRFAGLFAFILFFLINVAVEWGYRFSACRRNRIFWMGYLEHSLLYHCLRRAVSSVGMAGGQKTECVIHRIKQKVYMTEKLPEIFRQFFLHNKKG